MAESIKVGGGPKKPSKPSKPDKDEPRTRTRTKKAAPKGPVGVKEIVMMVVVLLLIAWLVFYIKHMM